ncbi:lipoprotein-releasing ABC transporter ATP-binding protein LolD [Sessilibacter sp. MAH4]
MNSAESTIRSNQKASARVVLQCQNLSKVYLSGPEPVKVLNNINVSIFVGETIAIVGSSGAGKSTLLNILGGLDLPTEGTVSLLGNDFAKLDEVERSRLRNKQLGFVYQFHHLLPEFSALENVAMPLIIGKLSKNEAQERAKDVLDKVNLSARIKHRPSELSGGERQRVAIARAIVSNPACVLMDEPTGNLDRKTAESIQDLMQSLNTAYDTSFVIVTHDEALAEQQNRILFLSDGVLQEK